MFKKDGIYRKSAKGSEAITNRQHGLAPKLRSTLILVDGKRSFPEIARLATALGDAEQHLTQLLDDGFIEEAVAPPASAAPAPSLVGNEAVATTSLPEARRFAVRRLTDVLGPTAEDLCLRIESARTPQEYLTAIARAETLVRELRGQETAASFAADLQSHRPG